MKIRYREPNHEVNKGKPETLYTFFSNVLILGLSMAGLLTAIKLIFSFAAPFVPYSFEYYPGMLFRNSLAASYLPNEHNASLLLTEEANRIRESFAPQIPSIQANVICSPIPNAFALPGLQIIFTSALLKELEKPEEFYLVLGHEIGHIVNRDNLELLGEMFFQIVFSVAVKPFVGSDGGWVLSTANTWTSRGFSRNQELEADEFGMGVISKLFTDPEEGLSLFTKFKAFIKKMSGKEEGEISSLSSTHPLSDKRTAKAESFLKNHPSVEANTFVSRFLELKTLGVDGCKERLSQKKRQDAELR
ncbi:MAG: M48 family metallopeptidase [Bdellovibrionales bacterium]|nr:M48 family metallopeptidase [Bdellovibrionales bacterium]